MERMQKRILIAVKTYPILSTHHQEVICTAGFLENGSWIRLYPIPFRYIKEQFKKYQWISVETRKHPADKRPESHLPIGRIRLGPIIATNRDWQERKSIVLSLNIWGQIFTFYN